MKLKCLEHQGKRLSRKLGFFQWKFKHIPGNLRASINNITKFLTSQHFQNTHVTVFIKKNRICVLFIEHSQHSPLSTIINLKYFSREAVLKWIIFVQIKNRFTLCKYLVGIRLVSKRADFLTCYDIIAKKIFLKNVLIATSSKNKYTFINNLLISR